jgi:hypothetical protein
MPDESAIEMATEVNHSGQKWPLLAGCSLLIAAWAFLAQLMDRGAARTGISSSMPSRKAFGAEEIRFLDLTCFEFGTNDAPSLHSFFLFLI